MDMRVVLFLSELSQRQGMMAALSQNTSTISESQLRQQRAKARLLAAISRSIFEVVACDQGISLQETRRLFRRIAPNLSHLMKNDSSELRALQHTIAFVENLLEQLLEQPEPMLQTGYVKHSRSRLAANDI